MSRPTAKEAVQEVRPLLHRQPVFIAGSSMAAISHDLPDAYSDIDVFVPSQQVLVSTVQLMLDRGYTLDDRMERTWYRWLRYGMKGWHTNSLRLHSLQDTEINVVYKLVDGHATTSLAQVLESFDFGLLATGWDAESDMRRDLRGYLFPNHQPDGPLPLMPNKRANWRNGFISQYNGLRQGYRYAKYHDYGYDMSFVADDLVIGYRMAALYHKDHFDVTKHVLGDIYLRIAQLIEGGGTDELIDSYKTLDFNDPLDQIMEALE